MSIAMAVSIGIIVGTYVVLILGGLVIPGRKGDMRTLREVTLPRFTLEEARLVFIDRLKADRFEVVRSEPAYILGSRSGRRSLDQNTVISFDIKPAKAEVVLESRGSDVLVKMSVWSPEFIFLDTGEGRYFDLLADRLLLADQSVEPAPLVRNPTIYSMLSLISAGLICVAAIVAAHPSITPDRKTDIALGLSIALGFVFMNVKSALRDIRAKPDELTGGGVAKFAGALAIVGAIFAWAVVFYKP